MCKLNVPKIDQFLIDEDLTRNSVRSKLKSCLEEDLNQIYSEEALLRFCQILLVPQKKYQYKNSVELLNHFEFNSEPILHVIQRNYAFEYIKLLINYSKKKHSEHYIEVEFLELIKSLLHICKESDEARMWMFENLVKNYPLSVGISISDSTPLNLGTLIESSKSNQVSLDLLIELRKIIELLGHPNSLGFQELKSCEAHRKILSDRLTERLAGVAMMPSSSKDALQSLTILTNFGSESSYVNQFVMEQFQTATKIPEYIQYLLIVTPEENLEMILKQHLESKSRDIRNVISDSLRIGNNDKVKHMLGEIVRQYALDSHTNLPYILDFFIACKGSSAREFLEDLCNVVGKSAKGCIERALRFCGRQYDPIDFIYRVSNRNGPITSSKTTLYKN